MAQLKTPEMTDEQKHDATINQWNIHRFNNVVFALECEAKEDYVVAARNLDEISLNDFLDDIGFAYSSGACGSDLKESIRATMRKSLESIDMNGQSFRDWYDDIQMKAAVQNIRLASRAEDEMERDWKLGQADKNLHIMFGQKAKQKAEVIQRRVRSFKNQSGISLFREAKQNFPRL